MLEFTPVAAGEGADYATGGERMKHTTLLEALELDLPQSAAPPDAYPPTDPPLPMVEDRADDLYRYSRSGPGGKHQHVVISN